MSDEEIIKKMMCVMNKAPHGTIYSYEGLEMVLIMATYDQDITMLFIDDGVYTLKKDQKTDAIGIKGFANTFPALDGYDVEKLYVEKESLEARGLTVDDLIVGVEVFDSAEIAKIMAEQDVVVPA